MDPSDRSWLDRLVEAVEAFFGLRPQSRIEERGPSLAAADLQAEREGAARIADLVQDTPEAARAAVEILETMPWYHAPSWRSVASLALACGDPELCIPLERLNRRVPEGALVLRVATETLRLHLKAQDIAQVLDAEVDAGSRTSRSVEVRGRHRDLPFELQVSPDGLRLRLDIPGLEWTATLDDLPSEPPSRAVQLATLHPSVRGPAATLLRRVAEFELRAGGLALLATRRPPSRVQALLDVAASVALAAQGLPASDHARLEAAYRDEDEPVWRLAFARARLSLRQQPGEAFRERLLADPFPEVRALAAEALGHLPTWVALASQPGMSERLVDRALDALRWELALPEAVVGAHRAGVALHTPERRWVLERVVQIATPELEPVLLIALQCGGAALQRSALAALGEVGSVAAVPELRAVAESWTTPGLARAAREALDAIREREGVVAGALSLVADPEQVGALSTAERPEAGGLSDAD